VTAAEATSSAFVAASESLAGRISSNEARTGSYATTGSNQFNGSQTVTGSLTATGTITAQTLVVQTITSSVDFVTGSAKFGSIIDNTHQFTGSVLISGSISATGITNSGDSLVNSVSYLGGQNTLQSTDKPHFFRINGGGLGISANNEGAGHQPIYLYTAGTIRLTVSGSGNVGIGTTNPVNRLHLFASNNAASVRLQNTAANKVWDLNPSNPDVSNTGFTIHNVTDNTKPFHIMDGGNVGIGTTNPGEVLTINGSLGLQRSGTQIWHLNVDSSNNLNFTRSGIATRTIITSDGYVGIGITNPFTTFHVHSTPDGNYGNQTLFDSRTATINYGGVLSFAGYKTSTTAANVWAQIAGRNEAGNGTENGYLAFITNTGTTYAERMRITSGGSVGIGTTSPGKKLDVSHSDENLLRLQRTGASARQWDINIKPNFTIGDNTAAADRFTIDTSGNVGIGTATPTANGLTIYQGGSDRRIMLELNRPNSPGLQSAIQFTVGSSVLVGQIQHEYVASNLNHMSFTLRSPGASNFVALWLNNDGNVGIGTTGPVTKLSLGGYTGARLAYVDGTNYTFNTNGITVPSSNNANAGIGGGIDLTNNTYSAGAYSPIISFSSLSSNSAYNNAYAGIWGIVNGSGVDANWIAGHLIFGTGGGAGITERMRITNAGLVLIGQTASSLSDNGWQLSKDGGGHTAFQVTNNEAFIFNNRTGGTTYQIDFRTLSVERGAINVTDSGVTYNTTSDYRVKEDFKPVNGLDKLSQINVYDFKWKINGERSDGVIAHELQEVLPYAVYGEKDGAKYQGVDYSKIVPVLIASIKELKAEIDILKSK
jgi:hypothetical protein